jgi:hypothetical protein
MKAGFFHSVKIHCRWVLNSTAFEYIWWDGLCS